MSSNMPVPDKGFFGSLFDFSFSSYVTPKLIKIIYGIVMAVSALVAFIFVVGAFRANAGLGVLVLFVIAPLFFFFYIILYRVLLEVVMAVFRIAENTTIMAAAASPAATTSAGPPQQPAASAGWGPSPGAPSVPAPAPWTTDQAGIPPAQPGQP
jgi:hypothetical protein